MGLGYGLSGEKVVIRKYGSSRDGGIQVGGILEYEEEYSGVHVEYTTGSRYNGIDGRKVDIEVYLYKVNIPMVEGMEIEYKGVYYTIVGIRGYITHEGIQVYELEGRRHGIKNK